MLTSATAATQRTLLGLGSMALASDLDYMDQETQFLTFVSLGGSPVLTGQPVLSAAGIKFHDGTVQTTAAANSSFFAPINSPHFTGLPWLGISGIKFYDGTIQTTAATGGGGGSYLPLADGGTVTATSTGATTVIDGFSIVSTYAGYNSRAELNPIATGVYDTATSASALLIPTAGLVLVGAGMGVTFADGSIQTTAAVSGSSIHLKDLCAYTWEEYNTPSTGLVTSQIGRETKTISASGITFDPGAARIGIKLAQLTAPTNTTIYFSWVGTQVSVLHPNTFSYGFGFYAGAMPSSVRPDIGFWYKPETSPGAKDGEIMFAYESLFGSVDVSMNTYGTLGANIKLLLHDNTIDIYSNGVLFVSFTNAVVDLYMTAGNLYFALYITYPDADGTFASISLSNCFINISTID
jgi:hypothetical protein